MNMRQHTAYIIVSLLLLTGLLTACGKKDKVDIGSGDDIIETQTFIQVMPSGKTIVHPEYGEQKWFSYGPVSGKKETPANGVMYGRLFEDGTYVHSMNINIEPPAKGSFYQGWLKDEDGAFVKTERLYNRFGDVRHSFEFTVNRDLTEYISVVVSLESDDDITSPTAIVAEGILKKAKQQ